MAGGEIMGKENGAFIFSFLWQINYYCIMKEYKTQILQANFGTNLNGKSDSQSVQIEIQ